MYKIPNPKTVSLNAVPAGYLRLDVQVPAATDNRAGCSAGTSPSFPNGRRLGDDVVGIALRVLGGARVPGRHGCRDGLGDGVSARDEVLL